MSTHNVNEIELLEQLETLLGNNSAGQDAPLQKIYEELALLPKDLATSTLEQAYQSLGTAVGKDSKIIFISDPRIGFLTQHRGMADTISEHGYSASSTQRSGFE